MASAAGDANEIALECQVSALAHARHYGKRAIATTASMLAIAAILTGTATAASEKDRLDELFNDESKSWSEIAVQLPAPPQPANLLPFDVSNVATQKFAVDAKSLDVGSDGVIRFTLVAISTSGARNVSYQGIRCAANEHKIYALGQADGTWSRARRDQWDPIINNAMNRQQAALAGDYFCRGGGVAGKLPDMLRRLRQREVLNKDLLN